jgi:hypothetical protein
MMGRIQQPRAWDRNSFMLTWRRKRKPNYWGNPYIRFTGHNNHQSKGSKMAEKILRRIDSICYWKKH